MKAKRGSQQMLHLGMDYSTSRHKYVGCGIHKWSKIWHVLGDFSMREVDVNSQLTTDGRQLMIQ